jgi:hypothetical protein
VEEKHEWIRSIDGLPAANIDNGALELETSPQPAHAIPYRLANRPLNGTAVIRWDLCLAWAPSYRAHYGTSETRGLDLGSAFYLRSTAEKISGY